MDSQQILKYGINGPKSSNELSYSSAPPHTSCSTSTRTIKFDLGNSPSSPLSNFDSGSLSKHSYSQELQYSSTETISNQSPSQNSPLEINSLPYAISSQRMRNALQEIETVLMAPDAAEKVTAVNPNLEPETLPQSQQPQLVKQRSRNWSPELYQKQQSPEKSRPEKKQKETKDVKRLLIECAEALSDNRIDDFKALVEETRKYVSINGDPIQRLGDYMREGLVARYESSGTNIYQALRCREPESKELLSYMRKLYNICPYFKFGYMAANGAIAEAMRDEEKIHIIDFQVAQGTQWMTLIQALAARPGGPPHVRITGIDDPVSEYARGCSLELVGKMLADMSKKFNIPLEFTPLPVYGPDVKREMLEIRPDEALAVNFTLQLHHTPDESVDVNNPRDGLLRMVKGLSPKVTTLVEQESNTNTTPFLTRFVETLDYYSAMFESIDVTLPRNSKERISVEQHCLAKDIVNIIACEGKERVERHELLGKWRMRFHMAGFKPYPLSSYVNSVIKTLLGYYSKNYTLEETDGAMLLGWKNRNLISASAWQ